MKQAAFSKCLESRGGKSGLIPFEQEGRAGVENEAIALWLLPPVITEPMCQDLLCAKIFTSHFTLTIAREVVSFPLDS